MKYENFKWGAISSDCSSDLRSYKLLLAKRFRRIYPGVNVKIEWSAMLSEETWHSKTTKKFPKKMYGPRIDIAIGPFALDEQFAQRYDHLINLSQLFINEIFAYHDQNIRNFGSDYLNISFEQLNSTNYNARCFLAIEIEKGNDDAKYLMGSAINASALGRVGIFLAWNEKQLNLILRIREYLQFLGTLDKNTFNTNNLLILDRDQLWQVVESAHTIL